MPLLRFSSLPETDGRRAHFSKQQTKKPMNNKSPLEERAHWQELALSVYNSLARNRAYALTDDAKRSLGALAAGWREAGNSFASADNGRENFGKFLIEIGRLVPGLFQENASDPPELPKPWVDLVTGTQLKNPWETGDAKAKLLLGKRDPLLAAHFQRMAKDPYGTIAVLQDAQAAAARKKAIKYDEKIHEINPFVTGTNLSERSRLAITDPERFEVYRREAKPLTLPWQLGARNLTGMGRLAKNPEVRSVVNRAENILRVWVTEELKYTKAELEQEI
jgi:hypothetical protein